MTFDDEIRTALRRTTESIAADPASRADIAKRIDRRGRSRRVTVGVSALIISGLAFSLAFTAFTRESSPVTQPRSLQVEGVSELGSGGQTLVASDSGPWVSLYDGLYQVSEGGDVKQVSDQAPDALATDGRLVWAAMPAGGGEVLRAYDGSSAEEYAQYALGHVAVDALTVQQSSIWVAVRRGDGPALLRLDANTGEQIASVSLGAPSAGSQRFTLSIQENQGRLWLLLWDVTDGSNHQEVGVTSFVLSIDESDYRVTTLTPAEKVSSILASGGSLLMSLGNRGALSLDIATGDMARLDISGFFELVAADEEGPWFIQLKPEAAFLSHMSETTKQVDSSIQLPVDEGAGQWPVAGAMSQGGSAAWVLNQDGSLIGLSSSMGT